MGELSPCSVLQWILGACEHGHLGQTAKTWQTMQAHMHTFNSLVPTDKCTVGTCFILLLSPTYIYSICRRPPVFQQLSTSATIISPSQVFFFPSGFRNMIFLHLEQDGVCSTGVSLLQEQPLRAGSWWINTLASS